MKKRIIINLLICFVLVGLLVNTKYVNLVQASETIISADDAKKLAIAQINSDRLTDSESFKENIHINKMENLYSMDGTISAYLLAFEDSDMKPAGYIIVGASRNQVPIIEYAYKGRCFLDRAKQYITAKDRLTETSLEMYYTGGLNYYIGEKKNAYIYKVSPNGIELIKREEINLSEISVFNFNGKEEANNMWKIMENNIAENNISNVKDNIIFRVDKYKSAYNFINSSKIKDYDKTSYLTIYDHQDNLIQPSGPICGINILKYWCGVDVNFYSFKQKSWDTLFENIYDDLYIAYYSKTYPEDYLEIMKNYFSENTEGCSSYGYYNFNTSWDNITDELDNKCPVTIILQGGISFGYEYLLGLGYKEFISDLGNCRYILVADGLGSEANRYVNYFIGYKSGTGIAAIRLRPN